PDLANFETMFDLLRTIGTDRSRLLHVAESLYHDHEPANRLGLPSVWINRAHASGGASAAPKGSFQPEIQFATMAAFADFVLG
ncbi:MAG: haloacid dehalogenase, partial [Acidimicrobiia bacterium]|nr:haloacid dehalogenase [Acidimicrobiia bacterium]